MTVGRVDRLETIVAVAGGILEEVADPADPPETPAAPPEMKITLDPEGTPS